MLLRDVKMQRKILLVAYPKMISGHGTDSANIYQNYNKNKGAQFFWLTLYILLKFWTRNLNLNQEMCFH